MPQLPLRVELGIVMAVCILVLGFFMAQAESTGKRQLLTVGLGIVFLVTVSFTARVISSRCAGSVAQCPSDFASVLK